MICACIQHKTYPQIIEIVRNLEMAEIRLDRCNLSDDEITDIFRNCETPLVATCRFTGIMEENPQMKIVEARIEAERRLRLAIEAGARFADMEIEQPAAISKEFQNLCRENGVEIIRSYHNFTETPDIGFLRQVVKRCFRYGAEIAKITTLCNSAEDVETLMSLYSEDDREGRLLVFGMGDAATESRFDCLTKGAPFTYASLSPEEATAPGQQDYASMYARLYGGRKPFAASGLRMPASKSLAQRAIMAAALADGVSHLHGYTPCGDSEAAISLIRELGAEVSVSGTELEIKGKSLSAGALSVESVNAGESGLLARMSVPVLSVLNKYPFTVDGRGTLLRRPLRGAANTMAAFGVVLANAGSVSEKELYIPLKVRGNLIPGTADISGADGSQLVSGILMALPLCDKDSTVYLSEPKSIPYIYMTVDVLREFGINIRSEMEGNAEMLQQQDWSYCTGMNFRIRARSAYKPADFTIEGDWSSAAPFLVAGAVFGSASIRGLDSKSLQADISILDILVDAGAVVSVEDEGAVCVRKAPLEGFSADLNHCPDLFPPVAVLAAFCNRESRIAGIGRLAGKESDRASVLVRMLSDMGVGVTVEGDEMVITGESLTQRLVRGNLLKGGEFSSYHDHRVAMALKVASLAADKAVVIDDKSCVSKSFPDFFDLFDRSAAAV